ncbi:phosphotyrosine-specific ptp2-like protein [Coemansia sp. Benny D115]|nr:phosphotyrosine-specific ptp2-like protein [Coemansia sp. Benny D115]
MRFQPKQSSSPVAGSDDEGATRTMAPSADQWFHKAKSPAISAASLSAVGGGNGNGSGSGGGLSASSIAQRRLQRKPFGLQLDTSSANMAIGGGDGPPPPPTARGTWTMGASQLPATPMAPTRPNMAMRLQMPMTPSVPVQMSLQPATPMTPSEGSESLGLFARGMGLSRRPEAPRPAPPPVQGLDFISVEELAQLLVLDTDDTDSGLVIDVRAASDYAAAHICSAVSVAAPTTLVRRKTFSVERLLVMAGRTAAQAAEWKASTWVALYGGGSAEDNSEDAPLVLLARKIASEASRECRVCVLRGGYPEFARTREDLCVVDTSKQAAAPASASASVTPAAGAPSVGLPAQTVPADHPMLRSMREAPGGVTFDASDVVALRLPPQSAALERLPAYLRRVSGSPGAEHMHRLFSSVDSGESRRMSSMIGNNGVVTARNAFSIAAGLGLGAKNRYTNFLPFDSNRVRLRGADDYINASYVSYFDGPLYIATQGPLAATTADFWAMVWDHRVRVVVMLTREYDNGRPKCHRYWPQSPGSVAVYGNLRVELQAETTHPDDCTIHARRLRVTHSGSPNDALVVTQLQYDAWPDHGAPDTPLSVLRLRELARIAQGDDALARNVPMVVHCSAGCGRTGAFCTIDTALMVDPSLNSTQRGSPAVVSAPPGKDASYGLADKSYMGVVPQALRSKSSNASLGVRMAEGDADIATIDDDNAMVAQGNPRASRSLTKWNDLPDAELRDELVYMIVSRFRELRVAMVQTVRQFVFCHEALVWVALGAGPRPLARVLDRRLVAEWNRANYAGLSEAECSDIVYQLRGRHDMLQAMLSSEASSASLAAGDSAGLSGGGVLSGSSGRASIDVSGGALTIGGRGASASAAQATAPVMKRSNTVGPARRGFFGSIFAQSVENNKGAAAAGDGNARPMASPSGLVAPPIMKAAFSSDARLGIRHAPRQAAIAEEEETPVTAPAGLVLSATEPAAAGSEAENEAEVEVEAEAEAEAMVETSNVNSHLRLETMRPPVLAVGSVSPPFVLAPQMVSHHHSTPVPSIPLPAIPLPVPCASPMTADVSISTLHGAYDNFIENSEAVSPRAAPETGEVVVDYFGCSCDSSSVVTSANTNATTGSISAGSQQYQQRIVEGDEMELDIVRFGAAVEDGSLSVRSAGDVSMLSIQTGEAGLLDVFGGPPTSNAEDWRRSVLGHLDSSGGFSEALGLPGILLHRLEEEEEEEEDLVRGLLPLVVHRWHRHHE